MCYTLLIELNEMVMLLLNRSILLASMAAVLLVASIVTPVSAYNFEYYYFKTDKLVYEVGETIDMVAKLLAEFSSEGWCYVSFEVITDQGSIFYDSYMIPSSSSPQYPSSSYTIHPQDTQPGINGTSSQAIFFVKIFDTLSDELTDVVDIQINRGSLEVISLTPTSIEYGMNTTLQFKIQSTHTELIPYAGRPVSILLEGYSNETIFAYNTTTTNDGTLNINWNATTATPNSYNLTISTPGDFDFKPISQSFDITVNPAGSSINIINYNDTLYCVNPDKTNINNLTVLVEHIDKSGVPITNSSIYWKTDFSQGTFTESSLGTYLAYIPVNTSPRTVIVNLSSYNPLYMSANLSLEVIVQKRPVCIQLSSIDNAISGEPLRISINVYDNLTGTGIEAVQLTMNLQINDNYSISLFGMTNQTGWVFFSTNIPPDTWGSASLKITTNDTQYYDASIHQELFNVTFNPNITINVIQPPIIGNETILQVLLTDPARCPLPWVNISCFDIYDNLIASSITDINGLSTLIWYVSNNSAYLLTITLIISENTSLFLHSYSLTANYSALYPVRFTSSTSFYEYQRGDNATISLNLTSDYLNDSSLMVSINDSLGDFSLDIIVNINDPIDLLLPTYSFSQVGPHTLQFRVTNESVCLTNDYQIVIYLFGSLNTNISVFSAYYGNGLSLNITCVDDAEMFLPLVNMSYLIDWDPSTEILLKNIPCNTPITLPLPSIITLGYHTFSINISRSWYQSSSIVTQMTVRLYTKIVLNITIVPYIPSIESSSNSHDVNTEIISSGSIISPPPILFNITTSTSPADALCTSLESCPKFSSGTNILSTVFENSSITLSGNGHIALNRSERILDDIFSSNNNSSTARDVLPNDIIPHSALSGPEIITSVRESKLFRILLLILLTRSLWTFGSDVFLNPCKS